MNFLWLVGLGSLLSGLQRLNILKVAGPRAHPCKAQGNLQASKGLDLSADLFEGWFVSKSASICLTDQLGW